MGPSSRSGGPWAADHLTADPAVVDPETAPEPATVASNRSSLCAPPGARPVQLTKHETSVAQYRWSKDGSAIFFSATDKKAEDVEKEEKDGADAIFVDEGPNGQTASNWSNLWVFDMATKEERQITHEEIIIGSWDISGDGQRLALTARSQNRRNDSYLNEIYVADVDTGQLTKLSDNRAPEGGLVWAPDDSSILFTAADDPGVDESQYQAVVARPLVPGSSVAICGLRGHAAESHVEQRLEDHLLQRAAGYEYEPVRDRRRIREPVAAHGRGGDSTGDVLLG